MQWTVLQQSRLVCERSMFLRPARKGIPVSSCSFPQHMWQQFTCWSAGYHPAMLKRDKKEGCNSPAVSAPCIVKLDSNWMPCVGKTERFKQYRGKKSPTDTHTNPVYHQKSWNKKSNLCLKNICWKAEWEDFRLGFLAFFPLPHSCPLPSCLWWNVNSNSVNSILALVSLSRLRGK